MSHAAAGLYAVGCPAAIAPTASAVATGQQRWRWQQRWWRQAAGRKQEVPSRSATSRRVNEPNAQINRRGRAKITRCGASRCIEVAARHKMHTRASERACRRPERVYARVRARTRSSVRVYDRLCASANTCDESIASNGSFEVEIPLFDLPNQARLL